MVGSGGSTGGALGQGGATVGGTLGVAGAQTGGAGAGAPSAGTGGASGSAATGGASALGGTAGTTATGGASASGGTAGAPNGGAGGGAAGAAPSGSVFLTEDFESGTGIPAGWDNFIGYVKNGMNPQGEFLAAVDDSKKHGGNRSMHFHGGSTPAMITRPLPANTNKLYVRVWVWLSGQLGNNADGNHETLLGIRKNSGNADNEVRFGEIKGALGVNEVPSDALSLKPDLWNKGLSIPKEKWVCLEVSFLGAQAPHTLTAWADGMVVHEVTGPDQWHAPMPADFLNGKFVEFIIGWHSFSNRTADVWIDDLALGTERIGCN